MGPNQVDEVIKYGRYVMGSRTGLRMPLETKGRPLAVMDTLQGAIEEGSVCLLYTSPSPRD